MGEHYVSVEMFTIAEAVTFPRKWAYYPFLPLTRPQTVPGTSWRGLPGLPGEEQAVLVYRDVGKYIFCPGNVFMLTVADLAAHGKPALAEDLDVAGWKVAS